MIKLNMLIHFISKIIMELPSSEKKDIQFLNQTTIMKKVLSLLEMVSQIFTSKNQQ